MTFDSIHSALTDTDVMYPLILSLVSGALIGLEREFQGKPAGVRTHTLVCFASALMTLLGLRMAEWTASLPIDTQIVSDMARMPHAIMTGIGFLGAGVIFREGGTVQGLTTAASLWLTAALGIVFGTGLLELGVIGTGCALSVLILLRVFQRVTPPRPMIRIEIAVQSDSSYDGAGLISDLTARGLRAGPVTVRHNKTTGLRRYALQAAAATGDIDTDQFARTLQDHPGIEEVVVEPLDSTQIS